MLIISAYIQLAVKPVKPQKYSYFSFIFTCEDLDVMSLPATSQVMLYVVFLKSSNSVL